MDRTVERNAASLGGRPGRSRMVLAVASLVWALPAFAQSPLPRTPSPEGVTLYFISPSEGEALKSPVTVRFGLSGMGVAPAGVDFAKTGHHHLIVDAVLPAVDAPIPADEHHVHFGAGQTQGVLELPPGEHHLQLLLGDKNHIPHDPPVASERIQITIE